MAARENQGLQIAVMIFFGLVILLAITTYVCFKGWEDEKKKMTVVEQSASQAAKQARDIQDELNLFKDMMGFAPEDDKNAVEEGFNKDKEAYAVGFAEEKKTYRSVLQYVHNEKLAVTEREVASKQREQELKDKLAVLQDINKKELDKFKEEVDKATGDATAEITKYKAAITSYTSKGDNYTNQLAAKHDEHETEVRKKNTQLEQISDRLAKVQKVNEEIRRREKKDKEPDDIPDGRITGVNQALKSVWIDLGFADALKRQTMFSVRPVDANGVPLPEKKGSIEVTRIIDAHVAEARVIEDDVANPLLPGDKIFSPVWDRGKRHGFALAGFMDLDGDSNSDRQTVRNLILLNNGVIDAEVRDDGKLEGKLKIETRYLVRGDDPTSKNNDLLNNWNALIGEAQQLGVDIIHVDKFLSQLGWKPDERTVSLRDGGSPNSYKGSPHGARPPGEGRRTNNDSERFRKRQPPDSTF